MGRNLHCDHTVRSFCFPNEAQAGSRSVHKLAPSRYEALIYILISFGARGRNRTTDTRIFNPLLYP